MTANFSVRGGGVTDRFCGRDYFVKEGITVGVTTWKRAVLWAWLGNICFVGGTIGFPLSRSILVPPTASVYFKVGRL